jgi:hypothetical protein
MRPVLAILASIVLVGCEYFTIDESTLIGAYRASWDSETSLVLNDDGSYLMQGDLPQSGAGEWDFTRSFGDASVTLRPGGDQSMDRYDVRWNRSRDLEVVIDIERERVFTKVGF